MLLLHIHGFNSSPASATLRALRRAFPHAEGLAYPSWGFFQDNLALLRRQAVERSRERPFLLTGSSLGGFYASQLAALLGCNCALFNPVVDPAVSLRRFLGPNTNFHTGQTWDFTPAMLQSYAMFPDTRPLPLRRLVVLGRKDTLLNPAEAYAYWRHCAEILETDDDHGISAVSVDMEEALRRLPPSRVNHH